MKKAKEKKVEKMLKKCLFKKEGWIKEDREKDCGVFFCNKGYIKEMSCWEREKQKLEGYGTKNKKKVV